MGETDTPANSAIEFVTFASPDVRAASPGLPRCLPWAKSRSKKLWCLQPCLKLGKSRPNMTQLSHLDRHKIPAMKVTYGTRKPLAVAGAARGFESHPLRS